MQEQYKTSKQGDRNFYLVFKENKMIKRMIIALMLVLLPISGYASVTEGETVRQYFTCNGNTTTFTFTFKCNSSDDVLVWKHLISTGVETALVEDTSYTIAPTANYLNGGTVTISPALAGTYRVVIVRSIKKSQELSSSATTPVSVEAALDKLTRQVQDLQDRAGRSYHLQQSDAASFDMEIPGLASRAETFPYFNATGELTYVASIASGSTTVSSYMETLLGDADAYAAQVTLDLGVANVKSYGAEGNGVADDSAAIVAAIASGKYLIFFPQGTYLTDPFTLTSQRSMAGVGFAQTTIKLKSGSDDTLLTLSADGTYRTISNLTLDGNKDGNASTSYVMLGVASHSCTFNKVRFKNGNDGGIRLKSCNTMSFNDCWIDQNDGFGANIGGIGEDAGRNQSCEQTNFTNCVFQNNGTYGLQIASSLAGHINNITGCWFEDNGTLTTDNYIIINGDRVHVTGSKFSGTNVTNDLIDVLTGSEYCMFMGNVFHGTINTVPIDLNSGAAHNISIGNHGGSTTSTVDNDGENIVIEYNSTYGNLEHKYARNRQLQTLDNTGTPSVKNGDRFFTGGTTTITDFDDGIEGQEITVVSNHSVTIDTTSTNLTGSTVDLDTESGFVTKWVSINGTTWRLVSIINYDKDNSSADD